MKLKYSLLIGSMSILALIGICSNANATEVCQVNANMCPAGNHLYCQTVVFCGPNCNLSHSGCRDTHTSNGRSIAQCAEACQKVSSRQAVDFDDCVKECLQ